jgi:phosphatidate cytidylyltransferase
VLRWRLLVSALIIAPLVALLILDYRCNFGTPGIWLSPLLVVFTLLGVAEVLDLLAAKNHRPVAWSVYAGSVLVIAASLAPLLWRLAGTSDLPPSPLVQLGWPLAAFVVAVALAFLAEMARYQGPGGVIVNVALAVFTVAYVAVLMTFLNALRLYHDNGWGMAAVVSVIFVTKMSDTGAYTFGRLFGRHKMAPILSPKKTIEGGLGGLVTACFCSWLFFAALFPLIVGAEAHPPPLWACLVYGAVVGVAGVAGDLSESLLKRDMERKDSSRWMPGLGGILDVLDSLLLAAPAGYFCWLSGILGP